MEPDTAGVHEVVLPDEVAQQWHVPTYQKVAFDEVAEAHVTRLGFNHPLVEALIASSRLHAASTCVYINDLRLAKTDLADVARDTWGLPNSRVVEQHDATIARVRGTYILFNFKAALVSDEKHEQLVSVVMDANAGHAAVTPHRIVQATNAYEPDATLKTLSHAPMRWGDTAGMAQTGPLASATLHSLLPRAQTFFTVSQKAFIFTIPTETCLKSIATSPRRNIESQCRMPIQDMALSRMNWRGRFLRNRGRWPLEEFLNGSLTGRENFP